MFVKRILSRPWSLTHWVTLDCSLCHCASFQHSKLFLSRKELSDQNLLVIFFSFPLFLSIHSTNIFFIGGAGHCLVSWFPCLLLWIDFISLTILLLMKWKYIILLKILNWNKNSGVYMYLVKGKKSQVFIYFANQYNILNIEMWPSYYSATKFNIHKSSILILGTFILQPVRGA